MRTVSLLYNICPVADIPNSDTNRSKAVAEGAASFFLQKFVSSRVAKFTYGTEVSFVYDGGDPEHHARRFKLKTGPSGRTLVPEGFCAVLTKVYFFRASSFL